MPIIKDSGNILNKINVCLMDVIVRVFGRKVNYQLRYFHHRHHLPDFKHPQDLSEIVLSSMLDNHFLTYSNYADKIKVRDYVKERGLQEILLKVYAVWDNVEDIDFGALPSRFVIKTNNGCGGHYICNNKKELNEEAVRQLMIKNMNVKQLARTEPHYACITPKIFAEELMGDGVSLPEDYKFYCINGVVDHVMIVCERKDGGRKVITLNKQWEVLNYVKKSIMPDNIPPKPNNFDIMVKYAEKLSSGFPFVRVDLYDVDNHIYFGELTFSPNGGLFYSYTDEALKIIGSHF